VEILGVGPLEILLVLLLALALFGPKDIANNARLAGRYLNRIYKSDAWRTMQRTSSALRNLPNRLAREAELEDLDSVRRELEATRKELDGRANPPASAPPPEPPAAADPGMAAWLPPDRRPPDSPGD
jgi:sec-independent protein translocase protein TatB